MLKMFLMKNKTYDFLRDAQIVIPALCTLYCTLGSIWGLPYGDQVAKTGVAIVTFLGALLKLSSIAYYGEEKAEE